MNTAETVLAVLGVILGGGGGLYATVRTFVATRARVREIEADHDENEAKRLWKRLEALEAREEALRVAVTECQEGRVEEKQARLDAQRAHAECKAAVEELRAFIKQRDRDITQRVQLAVSNATSTPPPSLSSPLPPSDDR